MSHAAGCRQFTTDLVYFVPIGGSCSVGEWSAHVFVSTFGPCRGCSRGRGGGVQAERAVGSEFIRSIATT